jgi:hypothetical protein
MASYFGPIPDEDDEEQALDVTDEDAFVSAMEFIYRNGVRRPQFKVFILRHRSHGYCRRKPNE